MYPRAATSSCAATPCCHLVLLPRAATSCCYLVLPPRLSLAKH